MVYDTHPTRLYTQGTGRYMAMPRGSPRTEIICFRTHTELLEQLRRVAAVQERPVSWLIVHYIKAGLGITPTMPGSPLPQSDKRESRNSHF